MQSVSNKIITKIKKNGRGKIYFANDFALLESDFAVRHTLSRLCKNGTLIRLSAGIYLYPKIRKDIGAVYPSINEVVMQIAKHEKSRIVPTGAYALNALDLSMQVPTRYVFLTDGAARVIKIANVSVKLKKTVAKNLAYKGELSVLVVFALRELGKESVNEDIINKIDVFLNKEKRENIIHDVKLAPEWIRKIMLNALNNRPL
jgi:hypothetical protein